MKLTLGMRSVPETFCNEALFDLFSSHHIIINLKILPYNHKDVNNAIAFSLK